MKTNRIGFMPTNEEKEEIIEGYKIGELVKITVQGRGNFLGKLKEANGDRIILNPSMVCEPLYDSEAKEIPQYRLEETKPTIITRAFVTTISPASEEYLNRLLEIGKDKTE
ncbi:MAG: hypothetical protein WC781_05005 [Candidatus Pacearchaeota archaeon]|jgi:hypothetical protein